MRKSMVIAPVALCVSLAYFPRESRAQPSAERCASGDGPEICVRFDNLANAPQEDVDYRFDVATDPANPSVQLLRGRDPQQTLYAWRVWSWDAQEDPANIGSITSPGEYDYDVKIANKYGGAGALNASSISLIPNGTQYYSSVAAGSSISGNLTGDLTVQESSGQGGTVSFTVDGNVQGDITAATISALSIGGNLSLSVVKIYDVTGTMSVAGHFLSGGGSFAAHDISGSLSIGGNAYGQMHLGVFTGSVSVAGDVGFDMLTIWGSGSGNITGGAVTGAYVVLSEDEGHTYSGTATFSSVAGGGVGRDTTRTL